MKATHIIPPAAALLLVGAWNVTQIRAISTLEDERATLRDRIATASSGNSPQRDANSSHAPRGNASSDGDRINWKSLSAKLSSAAAGSGVREAREMMLFQERLGKMTKEEMVAALDEIAGLGLSAEARADLESMIMEPLIAKDPELALKHFADRIQSDPDGLGWQLSNALKSWAKTDLAAATAWFDSQIASGTFDSKTLDGRSDSRIQFESALLESLISTDPEAARRRIAALPEDQRREVLQGIAFDELSPQSRATYADLVRGQVPPDEREGSFAHVASELVGTGGFSGVSTFLDSVKATPQERVAAARDAANSRLEQLAMNGNVTAHDVDAMRDWLKVQAPDQVDSITGKALGEAAQERGKFKFSEASQLALQYQQSSGNDDVLVSFLQSYSARSNLEEAVHLADMIKDPARRRSILAELK